MWLESHLCVSSHNKWSWSHADPCAQGCCLSITYDVIACQSSTVFISDRIMMVCVVIVFVHSHTKQRAAFANWSDEGEANVIIKVQLKPQLATIIMYLGPQSLTCDHSHTFASVMQTQTHIGDFYNHIFANAVTHSGGRCCFLRLL